MIQFLLALLFIYSAQSKDFNFTPNVGQVSFEAIGRPSFLKIKGKGEGVNGKLAIENQQYSGQLSFNLKTLDTGISLRNQHVTEKYLNVSQFPQATLTLEKGTLPPGWSVDKPSAIQFPFKGELDLHGVKKPISGIIEIKNEKMGFNGHFEIKLSDFAIETPKYLSITVADEVKVHFEINEVGAI